MTQAQSKSYGGVKKKLMGAICMLLVASIMVVSSTYAWFTLSTAPEITGISTSVGANGNLEMALLNTDTYADMTTIKSAVGDSSAVAGKSVTESNITWGNLVNLDDQSYGLEKIKLMPAALSVQAADAGSYYKVDLNSLLGTPVYGADGRVVDISGNTYTGTWNATANSWAYSTTKAEYGVRAIGANDNLTAQQAGLLTAKSDYNKALTAAKSIIQNALTTNGQNLASAVTTLAMNSTDATISDEQQAAIRAMVTAADGALKQIDLAYIAVLKAAATTLDSQTYTAAIAALDGIDTYTGAVTALRDKGVNIPEALNTAANGENGLNTQKGAVGAAQGALGTSDYKTALTKLVDTTKVTINGYNATAKPGEEAKNLMVGNGEGGTTINPTFMTAVIADGGAMVEMPDGSGVFAYIGSVAGNYAAATQVTIENFKGLTLKNMPATIKTTATVDTTVSTALNGVEANGTSTGNVSLSDTYGYALDMAFRTNAASSYLKLQTAAAQRVYSDGTSEATQGGGSTMTFKADVDSATGKAVLKEAQVVSLMQAIRVAFIDPEVGTLYGIATLENITTGDNGSMKGELTLKDVGDLNTDKKTFDLDTRTANNGAEAKLMDLEQNAAKKLTVLVYLDGHGVDNGDVANAASSMTGTLNLQFSSSAELKPMENTALRNMEKPAQP